MNNPFDSQEFRKEFETVMDKKLEPITDLLKAHDKKLAEHEGKFREQKGAMRVVFLCGTALVTAFEGALHYFSRK